MNTPWWKILTDMGVETTLMERIWMDMVATAARMKAEHHISVDLVAEGFRAYADWCDSPEFSDRIEREHASQYGRDN